MTSDPGLPDALSALALNEKDVIHLKRENNPLRRHAMTFSCLGKLAGTNTAVLNQWKACLTVLIKKALADNPLSGIPLIVGLAESGIIPSALLHRLLAEKGISSRWICSTRRPASGICFTERHSHAPCQILPLPGFQPSEIWLTEDEITTGSTLLQVCLGLHHHLNVDKMRIFALADARCHRNKEKFRRIAEKASIDCSFHPLFNVNGFSEDPSDCREDIITESDAACALQDEVKPSGWLYPEFRPALSDHAVSALPLPSPLEGSLLAVGEAVDLGLHLVQKNPELNLHHVTLSPWEIDGRHIINRLDIFHQFYLYNFHTLKPPLNILYDPADEKVGNALESILKQRGLETVKMDNSRMHHLSEKAEQIYRTEEADNR